jgi:hypothetical protein
MYKANKRHLQPLLISTVNDLPEKLRRRLDQSWAGTFYRETFCRIREELFQPMYAETPSRPNVPVNVLVGLDLLKEQFGWSDEELYDHFSFDVQVRYALGYHSLNEGEFEIRSLYYFRERLSRYYLKNQINPLAQMFTELTDQQIKAHQVKTRVQRMDSTQILSNIVDASRLRLLVEAIQRIWRALSQSDQAVYAELLKPYLEKTAGQYSYRVKGKQAVDQHLSQIGAVLDQLIRELAEGYQEEPVYQMLHRIFTDNYKRVDAGVQPKLDPELTSSCLQSVDDLEATFRRKGAATYKGYVANLAETCDPANDLQLITLVQVAPNNQDDANLLDKTLPDLKQRTGMEQLYSDGGYGSPTVDQTCQTEGVEQIQTALRGGAPAADKLSLAEFSFEMNDKGRPEQVTCPKGQSVPVVPARTTGFLADFDAQVCETCPFKETCRATPGKKYSSFRLHLTLEKVNWARRRRRNQEYLQEGKNPRAAVEATVRSVKHPFPGGKAPVRGLFRVTCLVIASAITVNTRRIHRYLARKQAEESQEVAKPGQTDPVGPLLPSVWASLGAWFALVVHPPRFNRTCFSF